MKKFLCVLTGAIVMMSSVSAFAWTKYYTTNKHGSAYNDTRVWQTTDYINSGGVAYIPLSVFTTYGINGSICNYNSSNGTFTIENGDYISSSRAFTATFKNGSKAVSVDRGFGSETEYVSYAPKMINGKICIPARSLAEVFNGSVYYNTSSKIVTINIPLA